MFITSPRQVQKNQSKEKFLKILLLSLLTVNIINIMNFIEKFVIFKTNSEMKLSSILSLFILTLQPVQEWKGNETVIL